MTFGIDRITPNRTASVEQQRTGLARYGACAEACQRPVGKRCQRCRQARHGVIRDMAERRPPRRRDRAA